MGIKYVLSSVRTVKAIQTTRWRKMAGYVKFNTELVY